MQTVTVLEGKKHYLQIDPSDNVLVALQDLKKGSEIVAEGNLFYLKNDIAAKHKFTMHSLKAGQEIFMYGVLVGKASVDIAQGSLLTLDNVVHAANDFELGERKLDWLKPDVSCYVNQTFLGYHRSNGSVGTANYWVIIPLVFCENRNVTVLASALINRLGYKKARTYEKEVDELIHLYQTGKSVEDILNADLNFVTESPTQHKVFENVDGVKLLTHDMGCGSTRMDSDALCGLLAGYITHPNVAGATVLSLGCQHSQVDILQKEIYKRDSAFDKPLIVVEQQKSGTEKNMLTSALKQTFAGLVEANRQVRKPAPLSKLCIGLECGGSDGFSGISANPTVGYLSDMLVALGGSVILAEFPELCGVEQNLSDRCVDERTAYRFMNLMRTYNAKAEADGSGFYANPSPGNIKDGLITDAIKSAGAAKKGGNSPVVDVLDYPEKVKKAGLNLLCTPGSDVESTTAEVAAGANIVLFTTGLGTPTGNPIAPVIKLSTNTSLFNRMPDIIDVDCGPIITGEETIEQAAHRLLKHVIEVASGSQIAKAVLMEQNDFIPWKRGVSL
jgi:altronate hydrolase